MTIIDFNFPIIALAAIVPLILGAIWYNPKVFGNAWMKATGLTEEKLKGANMPLIFGITYVVSFFLSMELSTIVIHQYGAQSLLFEGVNTEGTKEYELGVMLRETYGNSFRTFGHGALHGTVIGALFVLPIITIISIFERKGAKYIFIHAGYWVVSLAIMGGILCQMV